MGNKMGKFKQNFQFETKIFLNMQFDTYCLNKKFSIISPDKNIQKKY